MNGTRSCRTHWLEPALVLLLTALAAGLRFYALEAIPPGFHHDEAFEALEALHVLADRNYHPLYFPGNFGVEPLFIYLTALAFKLCGAGPTVMRGVAALLGSLTVPALYWLGKELEWASQKAHEHSPSHSLPACGEGHDGEKSLPAGREGQGGADSLLAHIEGRGKAHTLSISKKGHGGATSLRGLGLIAAAVLAGLYTHIHFSRMGIEPILVPLDSILMTAFLWRGLRTGRWLPFALSGLFLGLSPYTYPAGRLLPFLALAFVAYSWLVDHSLWRGHWRRLLFMLGVGVLVLLPLGITFARQPELLTLRTKQVAILGEGRGSEQAAFTILCNLRDTALAFSIVGDQDPRNNLPGRPFLDPFLSALFYAGVLLALWRWRKPIAGFMLLWLGIMLVPTVLSEYAPHFRRALGAAPAFALLIGLAGAWLLNSVAGWTRRVSLKAPYSHIAAGIMAALFIIGYLNSVTLTVRDYFGRWASDPALFYAFDEGLAEVAQRIASKPADEPVYLSPRPADHPTLAFFLRGSPSPKRFDGRHCFVLPPEGKPATYWLITHEDWRSEALMARHLPDALPADEIVDWQGKLYARAYWQPAGGAIRGDPPIPLGARFGDWLELLGWQAINPEVRAGEVLYVDLFWQPTAPTATDYTVFVHLLGDYNPATQGPVWAGTDSLSCAGACLTSTWTPGERIIDEIQVQIPSDTPAGVYQLEVGWYDLATMERLPVVDERGRKVDTRVILGEVTVRGAAG